MEVDIVSMPVEPLLFIMQVGGLYDLIPAPEHSSEFRGSVWYGISRGLQPSVKLLRKKKSSADSRQLFLWEAKW